MATEVQKAIVDWLHQQPDWLQSAAQKLLTAGALSSADIQLLVDALKTPEGQAVTSHRSFDSIAGAPASTTELRLIEIGDISGIEALAPRTPLAFGSGNLAAIYGHNGSGKSGYTRILKRASGKPRAAELKPNVFEGVPASRQCRITYSLAGTVFPVDWSATGDPIDDLRRVDIFDTHEATFYLSHETEASYTPPAVALFKELASVCDRVKVRLQKEEDALVSKLPALPREYEGTRAGKLYAALRYDLAEDSIDRLTQWSEDDAKALKQVADRIDTEDPASLARKKRQTKEQLDRLAEQLRAAATAVGTDRIQTIRNARTEADRKRRIATQTAKVQTGAAELPGIGTDTWNAMWEAARAYSATAYPEEVFPVTTDGARCVLCQQSLEGDAAQRLRAFETFVQGAVETEAKQAEGTYKAALDALPATPSEEAIRTQCEAAGLTEEGLLDQLRTFWDQVSDACDCLKDGEKDERAVAVESPDEFLKTIVQRSATLEKEAKQNDRDADRIDRERVAKDKLDLAARRWTSEQADAIRTEIDRLKSVEEYERLKRIANSRPISIQAGKVAELVITQAYVDRFNRELRELGASRLQVQLVKTRVERGKPLHQIRLQGASGTDSPETILSAGELRIVSLAAFLADVVAQPHTAPFVFDDPISSLDQDFEWCAAVRLVELAKSRQVLVFTHRLSLYGALADAAKKVGADWKKDNLQQLCIEAFAGAVGHPADEATWNANTKKANHILLNRLAEAKKAGEEKGAAEFQLRAQAICTDFRKLLERTIEDDLLNQVVRRHRRSVTTDNRLGALSRITRDDCRFLDQLMTKYSAFEHSQSAETPARIPEEPELRQDLESLKDWRDGFSTREEQTP